ncbi:hypothetical protein ACO0RG_000477 [Hanseniaspora osmophila]
MQSTQDHAHSHDHTHSHDINSAQNSPEHTHQHTYNHKQTSNYNGHDHDQDDDHDTDGNGSMFQRPKSPFWDQPPSLSLNQNYVEPDNKNNLFKLPATPQSNHNFMESIYESDKEENDNIKYQPPPSGGNKSKRASIIFQNSPQQPPAISSFYKQGNNSSGNLISNPGFTFGGASGSNNDGLSDYDFMPPPPPPVLEAEGTGGSLNGSGPSSRRNSRYLPGPKLPPSSRVNKSPTRRHYSPERLPIITNSPKLIPRDGKPGNESPFSFAPLNLNSGSPSLNGNGTNSSVVGRAGFRKGHRYKHSSVSMNFFQEPEVKIPLNIAKALPIPDYNDVKSNLIWPQSHLKIAFTALELLAWIVCFQVGQMYHWNNFTTLSHFLFFDVLGATVLILVEILQQFEVWKQGTITFPFGINRVEVILSFAQAVSLCYMGLDLLFHIVEEGIVQFIEATSDHGDVSHDDIDSKIPHSHETSVLRQYYHIWYITVLFCLLFSTANYYYTYQNKNWTTKSINKLKNTNPLITMLYICYLMVYPLFPSVYLDYMATLCLGFFIIRYGAQIVKYSSNILLLGFPSQEYKIDTFKLMDQITSDIKDLRDYNPKTCEFKSCKIFKVNFNTYVALIRIQMYGGSNEREKLLRKSIDKYLRQRLCLTGTAPTQIDYETDESKDGTLKYAETHNSGGTPYVLESTIEIDLV